MRLREHEYVLDGKTPDNKELHLRPLTEKDWDILSVWNSDPEVLYFTEGDDVESYSLDDIKMIYRSVSKKAFCFIIEFNRNPIGECWLQKMNIKKYKKKYRSLNCHRIDIMIGEKQQWGKGIGTEVIRLVTEFGFHRIDADMIFGLDIADYNKRGMKAFQKNGYKLISTSEEKPGNKAKYRYDFAISKPNADSQHAP